MSNYNKSTNFAVKDTLTSGDPDKVVSGAEIDNEFNSIASAVTSKADKVAAATTDNFAALDANGNLKDSGSSQSSIETFVENFVDTEISNQKYKDQDALDLFNVTGSAPVYACRAWLNGDGGGISGTVQIRESGNVSSITDLGTGQYQINFTTSMQDTSYAISTGRDTKGGKYSEAYTIIDKFGFEFETKNVTDLTFDDVDVFSFSVFR